MSKSSTGANIDGRSPRASNSQVQSLLQTLEGLADHQQALQAILKGIQSRLIAAMGPHGAEVFMALRNKSGFTKEQAKQIYYQFRSKKDPKSEGSEQEPEEPPSNEEKITMIMDYMKETSQKLDKIEDDIAYLKQQVNQILKKI